MSFLFSLFAFFQCIGSGCSPAWNPFPNCFGTGCPGSSVVVQTSWITTITAGTVRNNFTGVLGTKITTAAAPISVKQVGRYCLTGNSQAHTFYVSSSLSTVVGSVSIPMTGCTPGTFVYAALTITLSASTDYYLGTAETSGGDSWYDNNAAFTSTNVVTAFNAIFSSVDPPVYQSAGGTTNMYGTVSFKY